MARTPYTSKHSASQCCACGQGRGDVRQVLVARLPHGSVWLCGDCAEREANRQAFLAAYVAVAARQPTWQRGVSVPHAPTEEA